MEHTLEGQLVIVQRLRVQAYTGAATTATIKDGLAPFAHHGHCGFPDFRTTNGLDGHLGPATTSGTRMSESNAVILPGLSRCSPMW